MLGTCTIKFLDGTVHTTPCFNYTDDFYVHEYDKTFGSTVCPIMVRELPFSWEKTDIDGVKWKISITGTSGQTLTLNFSIGSLKRENVSLRYNDVNAAYFGIPFGIWINAIKDPREANPGYNITLAIISFSGSYNEFVYVSDTYYYYQKVSLLDGVTLHKGPYHSQTWNNGYPYEAGTVLSEVLSYLGPKKTVRFVNVSESGSARFCVKSEEGNPRRYDLWGYTHSDGGVSDFALNVGTRSAFSWESDATPEGDGSMQFAEITLDPTMYYYDGQFKTPSVTVTINDVQLTEGTDYIKTYENNIGPGLASVLVAGQGSYTGSKRVYFSIYASKNPYGNLEPSGPSNTTPTYNYTSDSVGKPAVPTLSMSDIGFVRIYNPSKTQLQSLAQYLWTDTTFLDTIINHAKQLLENPIDGIICLNLLPCDIPNGGTEEFKLLFVPTGVQLTVAANQFVEVNCGKVTIETVYGSALDYAPYTKASMFLPYVGQVSLNIDEIMGKTLRVYYHIDIVSGGCVAMVEVDGTVMYQFSGHCAISMPLTGADYSSLASAMISAVKAAATIGANSGAGIAQAAMEMMSGSSRQNDSTTKTLPGEALVAVGEGIEFTSLAARNIANTVGAVMGSKPEISRTGTFSGNTGYLGVRRPYVILERPRLCNPSEYGKFNGYPSMQTVTLSNISGYTQVQQVQLTGISATASELNEIEKLLKSGVIL